MTSVADVEHSLSRARLDLLDKRKEIRNVVHQHYGDLISVSDHAICMSERINSLSNTFSHMLSLTKALRVRMATSQLSNDISPPSELSAGQDSAILHAVESILSLNGRILFLINKFEFSAVSRIITEELPELQSVSVPLQFKHMCESELSAFSKDQVMKMCVSSLGLSTMRLESQLVACIELIRILANTETIDRIFWAQRSALLEESIEDDITSILSHYDLSICSAAICELSLFPDFVVRFGESLIGPRFVAECEQIDLDDIEIIISNLNNKWEFLQIDQIIESAVYRKVRFNIPLDLHSSKWTSPVFCDAVRKFSKQYSPTVWTAIETELQKYMQEKRNMDEWFLIGKNMIEVFENKKHVLIKSAVEVFFNSFVSKLVFKFLKDIYNSLSETAEHPSGAILHILCEVCRKISLLKSPLTSVIAKRALTKEFKSISFKSKQGLFDLHFLVLILSSMEEDLNLECLIQMQQQVLPDLLDRRLYGEPIKRAAMDAVYPCRNLLSSLLVQNPATGSLNSAQPPGIVPSNYIGTKLRTAFQLLPVAKLGTRKPAVSGVTSFFNQVGKITLGTNKN